MAISTSAHLRSLNVRALAPAQPLYWPIGAIAILDLALAAKGIITWESLRATLPVIVQPVVTISAIMIMTSAAVDIGLIERLASYLIPLAKGSAKRLFAVCFALSAVMSAVFNNDSAILLLLPIVLTLLAKLFPGNTDIRVPFCFLVFMAAGVAPLMISNPINMIAAQYAGISFNAYLIRMLPVAVGCWMSSYVILRLVFNRRLECVPLSESGSAAADEGWSASQILMLALLGTTLLAYPVLSFFGWPVWTISVIGAIVALGISNVQLGKPWTAAGEAVQWEILFFLVAALVLSVGLRELGASRLLSSAYSGANLAVVTLISSIGSALINNHPMTLLNMYALEPTFHVSPKPVLAALIGGDLGPRLFPIGSLAGILWFSLLRRHGVQISIRLFCLLGLLVTVPALIVSVTILSLAG